MTARKVYRFLAFAIAGFLVPLAISTAIYIFGEAEGNGSPVEIRIREWASASGGWVAAIAAVATIFYLAKDSSEGRRRHRETVQIQLRRERAAAKRALAHSKRENSRANTIKTHARDMLQKAEMPDKLVFIAQLEAMQKSVEHPSMAWIENEVDAPPDANAAEIARFIVDLVKTFESHDFSNKPKDYWPTLEGVALRVHRYTAWSTQTLEAFLKETKAMVDL